MTQKLCMYGWNTAWKLECLLFKILCCLVDLLYTFVHNLAVCFLLWQYLDHCPETSVCFNWKSSSKCTKYVVTNSVMLFILISPRQVQSIPWSCSTMAVFSVTYINKQKENLNLGLVGSGGVNYDATQLM